MAETKNGIYYPDDYTKTADIPDDMKQMAKSVDSQIENIKNEQTNQDNDITTLQTRITELEAENTELKETINSMQIPGESEGNPIHLADSSDLGCEIVVVGNAEQDGTPTPENRVEIVTVGSNVNEFNINGEINKSNCSYGINGTSIILTATHSYAYISQNIIGLEPNRRRVLYFEGDNSPWIIIKNSSNTKVAEVYSGKSISFMTPEDGIVNVFIYATTSTTSGTKTFKNIKLEKDSATSYSPYGQGSVEIDVVNKNLFDKDNVNKINGYIDNSGYFQYSADNRILYIECNKNKDYAVSSKYLRGIAFLNEKPKTGLTSTNFKIQNTTELTLNSGENTYLAVWFYNTSTTLTEQEIIDSVQIEVGSTATDCIPHESQTKALLIQKEFVKIGDYEDTFIKQDGKWYEAHYSPKIVFDGTGSWTYDSQRYRFYRTIPKSIYSAKDYALSSHFKNGNTETDNNTFNVGTSQIFFRNESIKSSADWKASLAEEYANGTPLEAYYVRETPELIPCTEEQEEILNSFHTYKNITNISMSGIGTVKVNYKKDLETLFNNINSAIVGGN